MSSPGPPKAVSLAAAWGGGARIEVRSSVLLEEIAAGGLYVDGFGVKEEGIIQNCMNQYV